MPSKPKTAKPGLIEEGQPAPAFKLQDQAGKTHKLGDYRGRWVVLYFYPRDNTPGCTIQACGFRDSHSTLEKLNAVVLGVSPDDQKAHQRFVEKRKLGFPLLIDPEQAVAIKYGAWREKKLFAKKYMGIVRTTYLIDPQGKVARRWDKVKVAGHVAEVVTAISKAG